jgi:hypothetical protein
MKSVVAHLKSVSPYSQSRHYDTTEVPKLSKERADEYETRIRNPLDSSTWGPACARGAEYAVTGAPVASGTKAVVRKISTGRKTYRGMASEGLERQGKL